MNSHVRKPPPLSRAIALSALFAAMPWGHAWAQHDLALPGFTWGEVRFPASAQPEDRDNLILEGAAEQGTEMSLADRIKIHLFAKVDYTFDTNRFDYNNKLKLGTGVKLIGRFSDSTHIAVGAKYEMDRRFVADRSLKGIQWFSNWYSSWRLPCSACSGQGSGRPLAMPGFSWGEIRYPGSQVDVESRDTILEGSLEQGIDWAHVNGGGALNTFLEIDYIFDTKRHDWNNAVKPGLGVKLKRRIGKSDFQIGAKYVQDYRFVNDRSDASVIVFVNWFRGWDRNAP